MRKRTGRRSALLAPVILGFLIAGFAIPSEASAQPPWPADPPGAGDSSESLAAWIAEGNYTNATHYQTATDDSGRTTTLPGSHYAFTSPSGNISCYVVGTTGQPSMTCEAALTDPMPTPANTSTSAQWDGDLVSYRGHTVTLGGFQHDHPPFQGRGPILDYGREIGMLGFDCRMDPTGLYCANSSSDSGIRINVDGVGPYGCLQPQPIEPNDEPVGAQWSC